MDCPRVGQRRKGDEQRRLVILRCIYLRIYIMCSIDFVYATGCPETSNSTALAQLEVVTYE